MKKLLVLLSVCLLTACASGPTIDRSYSAHSQRSRVRFVVLHYTVSDLPGALKTLTEGEVSSHYLLTDAAQPVIYGLVDESRRASHAGLGSWKNVNDINSSSIGIEIVNPGFRDTPQARLWTPFPQPQIDALITLLRGIVARHGILPENILGHSDVAPLRKQDPGPMFPWIALAEAGLVAWPDQARVADARSRFEQQLPDIAWFQKKLAAHGYAIVQTGTLDTDTRTVLGAFQMKYRPAVYDGTPDAQTAALLEVLTSATPGLLPALKPSN